MFGRLAWLVILAATFVSGQQNIGVLSGKVVDSNQRPVAGARVFALNVSTKSTHYSFSSSSGEYRLGALPAGRYDLTVAKPGYARFVLQGVEIKTGETLRADLVLEAGISSEAFGSEAMQSSRDASGGTLTIEQAAALPLSLKPVRNPLAFVLLEPGVTGSPDETGRGALRINGSAPSAFRVMLDGLDVTNPVEPALTLEQQPAMADISEFRLESNRIHVEFGAAGGGTIMLRTQSGAPHLHGQFNALFRNETLNAGRPLSLDSAGRRLHPRDRDHNLAATLGGPFRLPGLSGALNQSFFHIGLDSQRARGENGVSYLTVPPESYRNGDFSRALTGRSLGADALGRALLENLIYDPLTTRQVEGRLVRDPFPGNRIAPSRFDPVAQRIQEMLPLPSAGLENRLVDNFIFTDKRKEDRWIPSVRFDQILDADGRFFFAWSQYGETRRMGDNGLPAPLSSAFDRRILAHTFRLAGEYSITEGMLASLTVGYVRVKWNDIAIGGIVDYPAAEALGLKGGYTSGMPKISIDPGPAASGGLGVALGSGAGLLQATDKHFAGANIIYQSGSHTYRVGAEARNDVLASRRLQEAVGQWRFTSSPVALPYMASSSIAGGSVGFPYAAFLLGMAESAQVSNIKDPRFSRKSLAAYWQDTWRMDSRLTLEYGLRWDTMQAPQETHFRMSSFDPSLPNPSAGGLPGAMIFEGFGKGRCNCTFTRTYQYAFGPRFGLALAATARTVLRAGGGVIYGAPNFYGNLSGGVGLGWNTLEFSPVSFGEPGALLSQGLPYDPAKLSAVNADPGLRPSPGRIDSPPFYVDPNGGRPSRMVQWSAAVEREITPTLRVEAAYIGRRSVWNQANSLLDWNALSAARLASFGLDVRRAADRELLLSPLNSPLAAARGFDRPPYAGFPLTLTVAQSLRPFPQFGKIPVLWAPLGNTWYDALQMRLSRRTSNGLFATASFTWQKELTLGVEDPDGSSDAINDVFNRLKQKTLFPQSRPLVLAAAFGYETKKLGDSSWLRALTGGWTLSAVVRYQSGKLLRAPVANTNLEQLLFRGTFANRVNGQPLFLIDINGDFDPQRTLVLNPAAWSDPQPGEFSYSSVYFNDYRWRRVPVENVAAGRTVRFGENFKLEFRLELYNAFNRMIIPPPESSNALATADRDSNGIITSGFGAIRTAGGLDGARRGQLLVRLAW